jgi:hypothetical protein
MTPIRQEIIDDYQGALIRLASLRANGQQYLLFAWLELFPIDMNLPSGWRSGERPWTVPGSNGWTCAFTATRLTTMEALDWYEAAANGNINIGPNKERQVSVGVVPLGPEPIYGRFCIPVDAPFTFRWHDTLLIGVGSRRRSASQAIDLSSHGGGNLGRSFTQWSGKSTYTPSGEEQNAALARAVIGGLSYLALLKSLAARRCGMLPETFIGKYVAEFLGW